MKLLLAGGLQRRNARELSSGQKHERGCLLVLDTASGRFQVALEYRSRPEHRPPDLPEIRFTAVDPGDGDVLAPTSTELVLVSAGDWEPRDVVSLPCFNDVHHARRHGGEILVANTGLDEVVVLDARSRRVERRVYLGHTPFAQRFDDDVDYRRLNTTGRHEIHPNHVCVLDGDVFVSGGFEGSVIPLDEPGARFRISERVIHDGVSRDGALWFTSVDGWILVVDPHAGRVIERFDLNGMDPQGGGLGWCRGLCLDGGVAYVGFSAIRPTANERLVSWVNQRVGRGEPPRRSRIAAFDLPAGRLLDEYPLPTGRMSDVFCVRTLEARGA